MPWAVVAVAFSALLMWGAFPPLDLGFLAFLAPVPLLVVVRRTERLVTVVGYGFLWGAVFYGGLFWWISLLGMVAWLPLTFLQAGMFTVLVAVLWALRLWEPWRWWLVTVAAWTLYEFLRARFPFGGFPWGSVGHAAAGTGPFLGSVQWIGPSGWAALTIAFAAGFVLLLEDRSHWRFVVDTGAVILLVGLAGALVPPTADGPVVRVAIVQGSSPCPRVHCQNENQRIFERHLALTRTIPEGGADLVVWPENSTGPPYEPDGNDSVRNAIVEEASRIGGYFLVSGTRLAGEGGFLNVNMLFSPDGVKIGEYAKRHPVPFGEYVPMRSLFDFVPQLDQVPLDMVPGEAPVVFPLEQGELGTVISFEGAFARSIRSMAAAGSQLLVVATNESTFGRSPASDQLIDLVRVNAAAVGQDVVLAAITGRSAYIGARGTVGRRTDLFEETVLYGRVQMRLAGPTPYTRFGEVAVLVVVALGGVAILWPGGESLGDRFTVRRTGARVP